MAHWKDRGRHPAGGIADLNRDTMRHPLVKSPKKRWKDPERSSIFKGKINYFDWAMASIAILT